MRALFLVFCFAAAAACTSGEESSTADAAGSGGPACTGAVYDACATNADCMSQNCHFFRDVNFSACVPTCTPNDNSTCPVDSTGVNGKCNNMGICKPAVANNCSL